MRYTISLLLASAGPLLADVPRVVTDIPPVHSLAAQVMGDLGTPLLLLDRGADAHDFQLKPSQIAAVDEAGLVIWIGPEMTPWLERALESVGGGAQLGLLDAPGTELRSFAGPDEHDDHAEGETHDHDAQAETQAHDAVEHAADHAAREGDHAHTGHDPHAWLDPANASLWLGLIATELTRLDPANASTYAANAGAAQARIADLNTSLTARLAPLHDKPFVVFHDAYGYFTAHYGLTVAGAIALGDAASPGAAHLNELRGTMTAGNPLCIFPEANHDPKLVAAMVEGTDTRIGTALDPEGSTLEPGAGLYGAMMTGLADALTDCLAES